MAWLITRICFGLFAQLVKRFGIEFQQEPLKE